MKLFITCLLICVASTSVAQNSSVYNINKYNGLTSNHVYCVLIDRLGYLWLGTTDGVYRYNGYNLRRYDYNDGLPNVDVWNLFEDKQGRIWLRSIAQHIGYIKNNRYERVYKNTRNPFLEIYPEALNETDDGKIYFFNNTTDQNRTYVYCLIENDTLKSANIFEEKLNTLPQVIGTYAYHTHDSQFYLYNLQEIFNNHDSTYGSPDKKIPTDVNITQALLNTFVNIFIEKYYSYYTPTDAILNFTDAYTGRKHSYNIRLLLKDPNEQIFFCYSDTRSFYCITRNSIIIIDSVLNIDTIYQLNKLLPNHPISGFNTTYLLENKIWGTIIGTNNNGVYIKNERPGSLQPAKSKLEEFTFLNNRNDTDGYWWNSKEYKLAIVTNGEIKKVITLNGFYGLKKVIRYDSTYDIILSIKSSYWIDKNNIATAINHNIDTAISVDTVNYGYTIKHGNFVHCNDLLVADNKDVYMLGISVLGTRRIRFDKPKRRLYYNTCHDQRFRNIHYSRPNNTIICYSTDKVFLFNPDSDFRIEINQRQLELLGFNAIEKIATDDNGNIFIKDYYGLKVINYKNGKIRALLKTYNLRQAKMEVIDNNIFVAGNFGILKARIGVNGNITITDNFQNTKNIHYRYLYDVQFAVNHATIKTDNGVFVYQFNDNNDFDFNNYKVIANYDGVLLPLSYNDTLTIEQGTNIMSLDVIKPTGSGDLRIEYSLNESPYQFSENQVILPVLEPGGYNIISLIASDESWRSRPLKFTIYIQPKWWQTQTAKRVIVVLFLLTFIGFVYLVIVMTRRFVNRNNERRNQRRELELKSIYSQINPHFIFNSLSTAQYFVKKNKNKEAYEHINQFSDLLRSYIKSSRAKYITIAEEIENLENYLELQLTRFEEKFEYAINVHRDIDPTKVKIPSLLLQPLVENALNHGIFHSNKKGNLSIIFKTDEKDKDTLVCVVDDDGIGRQRSKELRGKIIRKADSYGTILIKELIDTFNKYEKINIEIEYIDKQVPLTGTTAIIRIKNFTHAQ